MSCTITKRSLVYCRLHQHHKGDNAKACSECCSKGNTITKCRRELKHKLPNGIINARSTCSTTKMMPLALQQSALHTNFLNVAASLLVWWWKRPVSTEEPASNNYTTGYLEYANWDAWLKTFQLQTNTRYSIRQGKQLMKADTDGLVRYYGKILSYRAKYTQIYHCFRAGKGRHKVEKEDPLNRRSAPGSKCMGCPARIYTRLLLLQCRRQQGNAWSKDAMSVSSPATSSVLNCWSPRSISSSWNRGKSEVSCATIAFTASNPCADHQGLGRMRTNPKTYVLQYYWPYTIAAQPGVLPQSLRHTQHVSQGHRGAARVKVWPGSTTDIPRGKTEIRSEVLSQEVQMQHWDVSYFSCHWKCLINIKCTQIKCDTMQQIMNLWIVLCEPLHDTSVSYVSCHAYMVYYPFSQKQQGSLDDGIGSADCDDVLRTSDNHT